MLDCDWSSDVCSSDLSAAALEVPRETARATLAHQLRLMRGW
jgi:hypothetical protein